MNIVIAQLVVKEFNPPKVFAVYVRDGDRRSQTAVQQAFSDRLPIKTWNQYILQREVRVGEFLLTEAEMEDKLNNFNTMFNGGQLLPLLFERKGQLQIVSADMTWEKGDRIVYLLYTPRALPPMPTDSPTDSLTPTLDINPIVLSDLDIALKANDANSRDRANNDPSVKPDYFLNMAKEILKRQN